MTTTLAAADLVLDTALVKKYDLFGPRYTSYPTADRFHDGFKAEHYVNALHARNERHADASAAAVAVRARAVLQHDLLLLRVQQGHHQGPRPQRQVHQVRRPRDRHRRRHDRGQPGRRAAALGRRHADVPRARRDDHADGHAARRVQRGAGRRNLDRGRSAQGRRGHHSVPGRAGLQPDFGRRPGLRPRRAEGHQPDPERSGNAHA